MAASLSEGIENSNWRKQPEATVFSKNSWHFANNKWIEYLEWWLRWMGCGEHLNGKKNKHKCYLLKMHIFITLTQYLFQISNQTNLTLDLDFLFMIFCFLFQPGYWGLSSDINGCKPCDCDIGGSLGETCDQSNGQCQCRPHIYGRKCDRPMPLYFIPGLDSFLFEAEFGRGLKVNILFWSVQKIWSHFGNI